MAQKAGKVGSKFVKEGVAQIIALIVKVISVLLRQKKKDGDVEDHISKAQKALDDFENAVQAEMALGPLSDARKAEIRAQKAKLVEALYNGG